jgi:hypothetical protein
MKKILPQFEDVIEKILEDKFGLEVAFRITPKDKMTKKDAVAEYYLGTNLIKIRDGVKSLESLIDSCAHEFAHYVQFRVTGDSADHSDETTKQDRDFWTTAKAINKFLLSRKNLIKPFLQ